MNASPPLPFLAETDMTELDMTDDIEAGEFADDLFDEMLDREDGPKYTLCGCRSFAPVADGSVRR